MSASTRDSLTPSAATTRDALTGMQPEARPGAPGPGPAGTSGPSTASRGLLGEIALVAWQVRYEQRAFWRNRRRALASLAFPVMFLLIFGALNSSAHTGAPGGHIAYINFYVPGIICYAVMNIGFSSMAMVIASLKEKGIVKRMRMTPIPLASYLAGIVISTVLTVVAATIVLLAIGLIFFKAELRVAALPGLVVTLALGTICFTSLGIAISRFIPKVDSGMPILMFVSLPLTFISNVFFPIDEPKFLVDIGKFFPLRKLAEGVAPAFNPHLSSSGFVGADLESLAIWSVVGSVLMIRAMRGLTSKD
jgi:ABC-2 type transport system permease protein